MWMLSDASGCLGTYSGHMIMYEPVDHAHMLRPHITSHSSSKVLDNPSVMCLCARPHL